MNSLPNFSGSLLFRQPVPVLTLLFELLISPSSESCCLSALTCSLPFSSSTLVHLQRQGSPLLTRALEVSSHWSFAFSLPVLQAVCHILQCTYHSVHKNPHFLGRPLWPSAIPFTFSQRAADDPPGTCPLPFLPPWGFFLLCLVNFFLAFRMKARASHFSS